MAEQEIELKLLVAPEDMGRLRRQAWLRALRRGAIETQALRSVYFDTPDLALRHQRLALRIRYVDGRRIQTLKTAGDSLGGVHARGEWEAEITGDKPDPAHLATTPLAGTFDPMLMAELRPVVSTEVRRSTMHIASNEAEIALAFDSGALHADGKTQPLSEVELELVRGAPRALFDLALRLHACAPLRIGRTSKAEQAFRLLHDEAPLPQKWPGSPVMPGMSAAAAFQAIARSCLDHLAANEESLLATADAEAVHQIRVAVRRLRSAIGLFKPLLASDARTEWVTEALRALLRQLGPARDTDVFIAEILDPLDEVFAADADVAALRQIFVARRDSHYADALAALRAPDFTATMLALGAWIEGGDWLASGEAEPNEPIEAMAERLLEARDRKLRKAGAHLARLTPAERHRVRIRLKKLRYAAEFFAPLYPDKRRHKLLTAFAKLQDRLGLLNDVAVADSLLAEAPPPDAPHLHRAAGRIGGWHAAQMPRRLKRAVRAWDRQAALPRFWQSG